MSFLVSVVINVLTWIVALFIARSLYFLEAFKSVKSMAAYNRLKKCRVIGETDKLTPSVEDFRFVAENLVLLSSGQTMKFVDEGESASDKGGIFALDLSTEKLRKLELKGYPEDMGGLGFRPHGIEYSKRTETLYVVNHANMGQERVEMFKVSNPQSFDAIELQWMGVLRPNAPWGTLNAITETSEKDVYITQWLPANVPKTGLDHPKVAADFLAVLFNYGTLLLGRMLGLEPFKFGFAKIIRCDLETKESQVAYNGFVACNGITSSPDGKLVFVVDCFKQFLSVFERDSQSGKLKLRRTVDMPHNGDNVALKDLGNGTYELWIGTIPDFIASLMSSIRKDKRLVAGGFLVATYNPADDDIRFDDVFTHDGSLLPSVSTAARWNGKVLLSGPRAYGGVLICE